jgi:hypothetical protein
MTNKLILSVCTLSTLFSSVALAAIDDDGEGAGGIELGGGAAGPASIVKYFTYQPEWGSADWGVSLYAGGNVVATPAASLTERDKAEASALLQASARINGTRYRLLGLRANGNVENGRTAKVFAAASLGSADFWTLSDSTTLPSNRIAIANPSFEKTMVDERVGVWVGPVPVTFRVKVQGRLGADLNASLNVTRVGLTFTPSASASVHASMAIGGEVCIGPFCAGASAGVYTDLTLFSVRLPMRAEVGLTPLASGGIQTNMTLRGDVSISTLDGEIGVFAEAYVGDLDYRWDAPLGTWNGTSSSAPLFSYAGSACLVGNCMVQVTGPAPGRR